MEMDLKIIRHSGISKKCQVTHTQEQSHGLAVISSHRPGNRKIVWYSESRHWLADRGIYSGTERSPMYLHSETGNWLTDPGMFSWTERLCAYTDTETGNRFADSGTNSETGGRGKLTLTQLELGWKVFHKGVRLTKIIWLLFLRLLLFFIETPKG